MSGLNLIIGLGKFSSLQNSPNGTPSDLTLTVLSDTSIKLDWTRGSTNNDGTHIYDSTNTLISTVTGTGVTKTLTELTSSTLYGLYIKEYKGSKESAASSTVYATTYSTKLYDGHTVALYDYLQSSTLTKDVNNYVSRWNDFLGSGHDLIQSTASKQPKLQSTGVLFDGVVNGRGWMKTAAFTYNQPCTIYMVFKLITWANRSIFDGNTAYASRLWGSPTSSKLTLSAGTALAYKTVTLDTFVILRAILNGASSKLQILNETALTGDAGTHAMGGFILGASISYEETNIEVKEVILRDVVDSSGDEADIYTYLEKKNNLSIEMSNMNYSIDNSLISIDTI